MWETLPASAYLPQVRTCYELADIIKRKRPHLKPQVTEMEGIISRARITLERCTNASSGPLSEEETLRLHGEAVEAVACIDTAYESLLTLKHTKSDSHKSNDATLKDSAVEQVDGGATHNLQWKEHIMRVQEIMTSDVAYCLPTTYLDEVAQLMVQQNCGAIPVVSSSTAKLPVGIVTDRDITCRIVAGGLHPAETGAGQMMSLSIVTVKPQDSIETCVALMEENLVRRVVVVDESGTMIGMVTVADIAHRGSNQDARSLIQCLSLPTHAASLNPNAKTARS